MRARILATAVALLVAPPLVRSGPAEAAVRVEVRPGVTMRYLALAPDGPPRAAVILFAGGNGVLRLGPSGEIGTDLRQNFLIRMREGFARQGFYVVSLDAASDRQGGMDGSIRLSEEHAQDVGRVIADVRTRAGGSPVWLIGTSSGTMSAANAGARLSGATPPMRPQGIVLTSTQTTLVPGVCGKTVYDAPLAGIRVPVLVVSHQDDGCSCSPGSAAAGARLLGACASAPAKEHKIFSGGSPPLSGPCDAQSPHGFFGIEEPVVQFIADWIKAR